MTNLTEAQRLAVASRVADDMVPVYAALRLSIIDVRSRRGLNHDDGVMAPYFAAAGEIARTISDARHALTGG